MLTPKVGYCLAGQTQEHAATAAEAAVHGETSLRSVAEGVAVQTAAWKAYGAAIKNVRRTAKEQLGTAVGLASATAAAENLPGRGGRLPSIR